MPLHVSLVHAVLDADRTAADYLCDAYKGCHAHLTLEIARLVHDKVADGRTATHPGEETDGRGRVGRIVV